MALIDQLQTIVNDPQTTPENLAMAQKMLADEENRLAAFTGANIQLAAQSPSGNDVEEELRATLAVFKKLLEKKGGTANISASDIRKAVNDELDKRKINKSDLSADLLQFLNSTRAVTLTLKMMSSSSSVDTTDEMLSRPLMQKLLSDFLAKNNAYLYGGAGTGKTFIAEQLGRLLGWEVITLNCSQYTSPLDIQGGQTIDGYQEGKLSMAWSNLVQNDDKTFIPQNGCVLILDELPKIDPNTAGLLNDALAKIKNFYIKDGVIQRPVIRNGKNKKLELQNLFIVATGNVPLNTIDPDYEANFKQDLSLQDRFIGSTYEVFADYKSEYEGTMKGFAFLWIFLVKVREKIKEIRATNQAFVSLRLMINARETYKVYRDIVGGINIQKGGVNSQAITNPKTLVETLDNFFNLFKEVPRRTIKEAVDYEGFKRIIEEKNNMPYNPDAPDFNTPQEEAEAKILIDKNQEEIRKKYS